MAANPKLAVIAIHGVSEHIVKPGYANQFFNMLIDHLMDLGVIPQGAGPEQIAEYIVCEEVNYSQYGQHAEDQALAAYVQSRGQLYKPWDQLFNWAFLLDKARNLIMTAASDAFVYENPDCRKLIRQEVLDKIAPHVGTGDAVSVVGHSLGSVVGFDTIYYNVTENKEWVDTNFLPSNLFTMGSPILLFSLDLLDDCGKEQYKPRFDPDQYLDTKLIRPDGVWYNFLDPQDLVAYPLGVYFKKKYPVEDIIVGTGVDPLTAHSDYWINPELVRHIAERLKIDYERISTV